MSIPFKPKKDISLSEVQARYMAELLRGYIEGQVKRYRAQHFDSTYDLSDSQVCWKMRDISTATHHKFAEVVKGYAELVAAFDLEDNLLEL